MAHDSSTTSPFQRRYPPELRERAVRLVAELAAERGDRHGAVTDVARQLGIGPESVRKWVQQAEIDAGTRGGLTTDERERIKQLERENRELRRANEISTVYVDDPWFNWNTNTAGKDADGCAGTGGTYTCGRIGLAPNTAIAYSTWTAYYYTKWGHQNCPYWDGKFVSVLRKSASGPPSIALQNGEKDPRFAPTPDPDPGIEFTEPAGRSATLSATSATVADLDQSFVTATRVNGLKDRAELATALDGGHIAKTALVHSLVTTFPDYLLATVVGRHGLRGVAMFTLEDPDHPQFGGMTYADDALTQYPLVSASDAKKRIAGKGLKIAGQPQLVWGWSTATNSPYYPMWRVSTTNGDRYVTSTGDIVADPGLQGPAAN